MKTPKIKGTRKSRKPKTHSELSSSRKTPSASTRESASSAPSVIRIRGGFNLREPDGVVRPAVPSDNSVATRLARAINQGDSETIEQLIRKHQGELRNLTNERGE